jgi:hypothetical protein
MRHTCVLQFLVLCSRFSRRDSGVSFCSFDIRFEALHHVSDYVFAVKVETHGSASAKIHVEQPSRDMFDDVVDLEVACQCRERSISL